MPWTAKPKQAVPGPIATDTSRLGDMAERWVTLLASWKGCEVFENIGCTGRTDIVIVHPKLGPLQIDVKCAFWRGDHWMVQHTSTVKPPIFPVVVEPDGDIANWGVRWVRGKIPTGWENFWDKDHRTYTVSK